MSTDFFRYSMNSFTASNFHFPTGSINNSKSDLFQHFTLPRRRRDDTNFIISKLQQATWIRREGERDILRFAGRKNKNEILGLTNARLIKEKYLTNDKYLRDVQLCQGLQPNVNNGEFVLILRNDGRIISMTDDVENHLGKTMRSLYTQCINIFTCLNETDGEKLRLILNDQSNDEHQIVCTLRLPKGKRPSRTREDAKTIVMTGHFYSCPERLFIARCEALVLCQVNGSVSSSTSPTITNNCTRFILNEDMTINVISSNTKNIFGYSRNEILGQWFGRFLTSESLKKFQIIRDHFLDDEKSSPYDHYDLYDFYGDHGAYCLTFFCQIRPIRERRSKSIKYSIVAQLIDPSMRDDYLKHIQNRKTSNNMEIIRQSLDSPKTNEDSIMVTSPSLARGLLMTDYETHSQQSSPCDRSLSTVVAPFIVDQENSCCFFNEPDHPIIEYHYTKTAWADDLASIDALMNDY